MLSENEVSTENLISMIENGADVNVLDSNGRHALDIAVENGNAEIMRVLIAAGASRTKCNVVPQVNQQQGRRQRRHVWIVTSSKSTNKTRRRCLSCGRYDTDTVGKDKMRRTIKNLEIEFRNQMMALLFTIEKTTRDLTSDVKFVLLSTVSSYLYPRLLECAIPIPRCDVPIDRVCREVDPLTLLTLFQCLLLDRKIVLMSHKPWKLTDTFETVRSVRAWSSMTISLAFLTHISGESTR